MAVESFNIFNELAKWAKTLAPWQQCALKLLITKGELDDSDYEEIFTEFMYDCELLTTEDERKKNLLELPEQLEDGNQEIVVLKALREIQGVNALAPDQVLNFGTNITVIYGENASGKSGYSRVFKVACFTRSKELEILGNIQLSNTEMIIPSAKFEMTDGEEVILEYGKSCPVMRDNFAVFDSSCIRVHTDEKNSFSVTPYLFDVFPNFVRVCNKIQSLLSAEITKTRPDIEPFEIQGGQSKVAQILNSLSDQTNISNLESLAVYGETNKKQLIEKEEQLANLKSASKEEILKQHNQYKTDIESLEIRLKNVITELNSETILKSKGILENVTTLSKLAAATSVAQFDEEPLQPIGSETWRELLQAAIAYNDEAYPEQNFPPEIEEARCLLCQQVLGEDASDRLKRFFAFVTSDTENNLKTANQQLTEVRKQLEIIDLAFFNSESGRYRTLEHIDKKVCEEMVKLVEAYKIVRTSLVSNIDGKIWNEVNVPINTVSTSLNSLRENIDLKIAELNKQDTGKLIKQLEEEVILLKDRKFLLKILPDVKKAVEALKWVNKASQYVPIQHRHITEKQKVLMKEFVGKGFEVEFQENCNALNLSIPLTIKLTGTEGETNHQLGFDHFTSGKVQPSQVLCEGEQTAVALADFLSEIKLNNTSVGIIFDDPVNSFDHLRKQSIANRLVEEAKNRQVVIFTHDIVFTHYLVNSAKDKSVPLLGQTVSRYKCDEPGHINLEAFPHPYYEKQSLKRAQEYLEKANKAAGEERENLLEKGCSSIRTAYEHFIQHTLFGDVVGRWRENIKYTLSDVYFDEEIASRVQEHLEFLSGYIDAHSHTAESQQNPLVPKILQDELEMFANIRKDYNARRKEWEKKKKSLSDMLS